MPTRARRRLPLLLLIRSLKEENSGMIWPWRFGRSRFLRCAFASLALLLVLYAIVLGRPYLSRSASEASVDRTADITLPPPEDLAPVRANWTARVPPSPFRFTDIAQSAGIDFVHVSGMTEAKHFPTAYGSGVAMLDFDNDGKLDLYFATTTFLPLGGTKTGPNRLYRNLGNGRFQDATKAAGLDYSGFCHGIVVGDIDNDGDPDVFLCNYGSNVLFLNQGNGTFTDISKSAGIDRAGWSFAGAFLDYDNDGDLDLYVTNYGVWKLPDNDLYCGPAAASNNKEEDKSPEHRIYCSPKTVTPARHVLYRNNGNRTFTDVTEAAGIGRTDGRGLGVVAADLNDDGRIDLYVANDMCPNFVFLNQGNGRFQDVTETSGAGYSSAGQTRAGMGVDAEDVNGDGRTDVLVSNFWYEGLALFSNLGEGLFEDRSHTAGLYHDSVLWVGWGCALADFDSDGWPDCFVANGHLDNNLQSMGIDTPYAEPALLHRNLGGLKFQLATRNAGAYFDSDHVARGLAHGDIDNDGDIDIAINHLDGPPALLRNDTPARHHWLRLRLEGTRSNRDAIGARIELEVEGRTIVRQLKGGASLASAHDPCLLIGIGDATAARRVTIRWPSGHIDRHENLPADTRYRLREGERKPLILTNPDRQKESILPSG